MNIALINLISIIILILVGVVITIDGGKGLIMA